MPDWIRTPPQTQQSRKFGQPVLSGSVSEQNSWRFWEMAGEIYSRRWTDKNGSAPSDLWIAQIGNLTSDLMMSVCNAMVARCAAGNSWRPDLAEFVALVADARGTALGLKTEDVVAEYWRWRNESYRYDCADEFPWRHPVLYQICTTMRQRGKERQMTVRELEGLAAKLLAKWERHVSEGGQIPPVRKQISAPSHPTGPTPAEQLKAMAAAAKQLKN